MTIKYKLLGIPGNLDEFLDKEKRAGETTIQIDMYDGTRNVELTINDCRYGALCKSKTKGNSIMVKLNRWPVWPWHFGDYVPIEKLEERIDDLAGKISGKGFKVELLYGHSLQKKSSVPVAVSKPNLEVKVKEEDKIDFINPWDIEIPKLDKDV